MPNNKIKYVCEACGSEDVVWDAYAEWNQDTQEFELRSTFDYSVCNTCGKENCAVEHEITE